MGRGHVTIIYWREIIPQCCSKQWRKMKFVIPETTIISQTIDLSPCYHSFQKYWKKLNSGFKELLQKFKILGERGIWVYVYQININGNNSHNGRNQKCNRSGVSNSFRSRPTATWLSSSGRMESTCSQMQLLLNVNSEFIAHFTYKFYMHICLDVEKHDFFVALL